MTRQQYDYRHYSKTFQISKEAYQSLTEDSEKIGTIELHREHIAGEDAPTKTVDGEVRDIYAVDHLHVTAGGDVIRHREYVTGGDPVTGDTFDVFGHSRTPAKLLKMVYGEEWKNQEWDDNQYYWFEWRAGDDNDLPSEFAEELPKHIPRSAEPDDTEL